MNRFLNVSFVLFFILPILSQEQLIDVTTQQFKLGGLQEQEFYYGFAAGDKIIFTFSEGGQKELKDLEIIEYPSNQKFSAYKTKKIDSQMISVTKQGVYIFRFKNSALGGRVCKINIQRIPGSDATKNFNTAVTWETRQETTYSTYTKDVLVGHDTTYVQRSQRELVSTELREELLFDKPQRVHSISNDNGNLSSLFFTLPPNEITDLKSKKVISWAYWVGVGEEANKSWKQNYKTISSLAKTAAGYYTSPLGAYTIGAVADLMVPTIGEDVSYSIADMVNKNLFMARQPHRILDQGKGIAGFRKFTDPRMCQGTYCVLLENDNYVVGIDATVKVIAIIETTTYQDTKYTEKVITPRYEKKTFTDPIITTSRVPVTGAI